MIFLLAPSKTMSLEQNSIQTTPLIFPEATKKIVTHLQSYTKSKLAKSLSISKLLTLKTYHQYQEFQLPNTPTQAAIFAYRGDVYDGLDADTLTPSEIQVANTRGLILSGLYGVVTPLTAIQEYRLEMKTRLSGKLANLPQFWRSCVTDYVATRLTSSGSDLILDLASKEYSSAIDRTVFPNWVTVTFLQQKGKNLQNIAFHTKQARGMFARFLIQNQITETTDLKYFKASGYRLNLRLTSRYDFVFVREVLEQ